jgi:general L-amino acid transport system permease protein
VKIVTAVLGAGFAYLAWRLVSWGAVHAIWFLPPGAGSTVCRAGRSVGACWAVIPERFRFILFGSYPFDQQWRPGLVCALLVSLFVATALPPLRKRWLVGFWIIVPLASVALLGGGSLGLSKVPSESWGGLPLTLLLSTVGCAAALPPAVALALGRRSRMPAIRWLSIAYIEVLRGMPLVAVLFMAAVMFPLFMPESFTVDKLLRAQVGLVMVVAAYLAEVVRAGLEAVPGGQYEAAASVGLRFWPATILVVLPQALRVSIPALVNTFIACFKDTSLIAVIGLFDLLGTAKAVLVDPKWVGFGVEVYLFVALVYAGFCYSMSCYSRYLERHLIVRGSA